MVHTPDSEVALNTFLKTWGIKAPNFSWGQVVLLGKKSLKACIEKDEEINQLIDRALKREMSVIFIDFSTDPGHLAKSTYKLELPFNLSVLAIKKGNEQRFCLKADNKELNFNFSNKILGNLNGYYGVSVPESDLKFEGKNIKINALVTTGTNPYRYPVVELVPDYGKGKVYLCQLLLEDRIDESVRPLRNHPELPAYDPVAVQLLLNLISASVGNNLLK